MDSLKRSRNRLDSLSPLLTLNNAALKSIKLHLQTTPHVFILCLWDSLYIKASFSKIHYSWLC